MNTPNINDIRAMSTEDKATFDRNLKKKIIKHVALMIFIKATAPRLAQTLAAGAIVTVARRMK